jgi:hypothetical protein
MFAKFRQKLKGWSRSPPSSAAVFWLWSPCAAKSPNMKAEVSGIQTEIKKM